MTDSYHSWGNYPVTQAAATHKFSWRTEAFPSNSAVTSWLPYGKGRSYGDVCLNDQAGLLVTTQLNKFIAFDPATGILRCESGVLLADILQLIVPAGWFLPVTPGTKFVTIGGAIANDVHGKNHHIAGSFGCHIRCLELLRSDNTRLHCSLQQNADWFAATVGGLGLTGVIVWAEIQLQAIHNPFFVSAKQRFNQLSDYFDLNHAAEQAATAYTVAWIDCLASTKQLGRGIFMTANHAPAMKVLPTVTPPSSIFRPWLPIQHHLSAKALNLVYYYSQWQTTAKNKLIHYDPYLYPLDNTHYCKKAFLQYQCVIPHEAAKPGISELLSVIATSNELPFLAVLKTFGNSPAPGLLSFARPGVTLAVDFLFRGASTLQLFKQLTAIVRTTNGAIYPAKDAQMNSDDFKQFFPKYEFFKAYIDPHFSSSFWRRVNV